MKRTRLKTEFPSSNWTIEQDCFLIENSSLRIAELILHLPFTEEEINVRKSVLGLYRRDKQMRNK